MKKGFGMVGLWMFCSFSAWAQTVGLKGVVCDSLSGKAESYATVRLMQTGRTEPVTVSLTDSLGQFLMPVAKAGSYELVCSSIGKKSLTLKVAVGREVKDVGRLLLADEGNLLGTVRVKAQRPLVKAEIDKLSYSMADDPDAQTNSLIEMLRKVPMVTVDGEDNIQVNGSSSFKVYVNGKPNQMMSANPSEIFKSYPASAIKKIEVITNPGAKYDAEGVAGVLNIITNTETTTSGYSLTPNLRLDNQSAMGSFFGMAQFGKLTLSAHYGLGFFFHPRNVTESEREVFADPVNHLLQAHGTEKSRGMFQFGSIDGSYEFDDHNLLSFSAGVHGFASHANTDDDRTMFDATGAETYSYHGHTYRKVRYPNINASVDYQHSFREDEALTLSYRVNTSPGSNNSTTTYTDFHQLPFQLRDLYSTPKTHSYEHTGQLDYTLPLAKGHLLSTGLKYIYRINKSDNEEYSRLSGTDDEFLLDVQNSLLYRQRGDIAAAYAEYNLKLHPFSAMAGLRYEHYRIHVTYPDGKRDDFKARLGDIVPSVSFGYSITEKQLLKLGYNMRIERPGINALSPYVVRSSPETVSYGNPNLKTAKAHNVELGYSMFGTRFSISPTLTYAFSNDGLTSFSSMQNGVHHTTFDNVLHTKSLNLGLFLNWTIIDGTSVNLNGGANYRDLKVVQTDDHNHGYHCYVWGGITQQLLLKLKIELWMGFHSKEVELQGDGSKFYMYNFNLSRQFLKDNRLQVSLRAGNYIGRYHHFRHEAITNTFRQSSDFKADFLRYGLGISYRFGSLKAQVKRVNRSIENNDVQQQSSSSNQGDGSGE